MICVMINDRGKRECTFCRVRHSCSIYKLRCHFTCLFYSKPWNEIILRWFFTEDKDISIFICIPSSIFKVVYSALLVPVFVLILWIKCKCIIIDVSTYLIVVLIVHKSCVCTVQSRFTGFMCCFF